MRTFFDVIEGEERAGRAEYAMSLAEIARIEGISSERVRFIIDRAFRKLRAAHGPLLREMRRMYLHLEQQRARQEETER